MTALGIIYGYLCSSFWCRRQGLWRIKLCQQCRQRPLSLARLATTFILLVQLHLGICNGDSDDNSYGTAAIDLGIVTKQIQGQLQYRITRSNGSWLLFNDLTLIYRLPSQPLDVDSNLPIEPGNGVIMTCVLSSSDSTTCVDIYDAHRAMSAPMPNTNNMTMDILVMIMSLTASSTCGAKPGASVQDVERAFLGPGGYADYFNNCSYGKMTINRDTLTVLSISAPCSKALLTCDEDEYAMNAIRRLGRYQLKTTSYNHLVFVMPTDMRTICPWVGQGEIPGVRTWFTGDVYGIFSQGTVMQQILRNYGLYPSYRDGMRYDDFSSTMGSGDSCPSAPELWRLGWASPLAVLSSTRFASRVYRTFTLPATYLGPNGNMIKIQPDWLNSAYTKNMYLALRVKAGGDMDLIDEFNGKLNIHELDASIDNSFTAFGDAQVTFYNAIPPGDSILLFNYRLHIITGPLVNNGNAIIVRICRFFVGPTECMDTPSPPPAASSPPPRQPPPYTRLPSSPLPIRPQPSANRSPPPKPSPTKQPPSPRSPPPPPRPPPPRPPPPSPRPPLLPPPPPPKSPPPPKPKSSPSPTKAPPASRQLVPLPRRLGW